MTSTVEILPKYQSIPGEVMMLFLASARTDPAVLLILLF